MFMVYFVDTHAAKYDTCILCAQVLHTNKSPGCDGSIFYARLWRIFFPLHVSFLQQTSDMPLQKTWLVGEVLLTLHQISCNTATKPTQIQGIHATTAVLNCSSPSGPRGGSSPEASRRFAQQPMLQFLSPATFNQLVGLGMLTVLILTIMI